MTTGRRYRRSRLLAAIVLVIFALGTLLPGAAAIGFLEGIIVRTAIQTIGLKERERQDRDRVSDRARARIAAVDDEITALDVKVDRGWLSPQQAELERRRLEAIKVAIDETGRRERQIISFQTRRRIDEKFRSTLRDALKVASGADPRAIDFVVDIIEGKRPLEAAISAALSDQAPVEDARASFFALRDQLREVERVARSLKGAETIAIRARLAQALRETTDIVEGDGPLPDDRIQRLRELSGALDEAAARLRALRDELFPASPGIAAERFAHDERWQFFTGAVEALDSTDAKQRLTAAVFRRAVDRVVDISADAGLDLTFEQLTALATAIVDAWISERFEGGLVGGEAIDFDALVRDAINAQRAAAGQDPLFTPEPTAEPTSEPTPVATPEPTPGATPEPAVDPTPAAASFDSATGTWDTTYGVMSIGDGGGTYTTDNGRLTFDLEGRTLDGYWIEDGSARTCGGAKDGSEHWGRIIVMFDEDFTTFSGSWGYCDDEANQGSWSGTRVEP